MPEGLSSAEVGKEIAAHKKHGAAAAMGDHRHDRWLSIVEALLLSFVAVLAAYSGYAAAKWSTESSVTLAKASAERTKANRADIEGIVTRTMDSASFNAWFTAFTAGNDNAERLAEKRMRPGYRPAFDAWLATDPEHNLSAPPGPAYMPQYVIPQEAAAKAHDARADAASVKGSAAGETADKYIRATVFLATVLFLIGISGHFRIRQARMGLIVAGGFLLAFAVTQLLSLPRTARIATLALKDAVIETPVGSNMPAHPFNPASRGQTSSRFATTVGLVAPSAPRPPRLRSPGRARPRRG